MSEHRTSNVERSTSNEEKGLIIDYADAKKTEESKKLDTRLRGYDSVSFGLNRLYSIDIIFRKIYGKSVYDRREMV